ncbi:hypothetical protein BpHYR1_003381 [Brachionus plicatilis]|uniref:Uncharacterized protein n=1 Tax=Brachionus plicatilis TaxID=10195 RepID=A0A3M7SYF7_BRAPC|nr:hypothetical protein BpHYR1_003381 [Brachionus plicatilis]
MTGRFMPAGSLVLQNTTNLLCLPQCKSNEFLNSNEPINVLFIQIKPFNNIFVAIFVYYKNGLLSKYFNLCCYIYPFFDYSDMSPYIYT